MVGLAVAGVAILALTLLGLSLHVPHADSVGSAALTNRFVAIAAVAGLVYLAACLLVLRMRGRPPAAIWLVLGVAVALRLPVLAAPPFLSSDLYRYVWDGRVQQAGINPYRFVPGAAALRGLRDSAIYPHINRRDYAPTIYPPMAQLVFRAIAAISPSLLTVKLAMVGFEAVAVACLVGVLRIAGLPDARVLIYAWNPLAVWSFAGNGHVDALAIGLIAASLLCRARLQDGRTGALLAAAVLVKFLPLAIAPALWRPRRWRAPLAGLVVIVGLYGWYSGVGLRVFGFLSSYGSEEGISGGDGLWLLAGVGELVALPSWSAAAYLLLCAAALLGAALVCIARNRTPGPPAQDLVRVCAQAGALAACFMVVLSPHYSWYFPFLAVFATVAPVRAVLWLSIAPLLLDLRPWPDDFLWRALIYGPALLLAAFDLRAMKATAGAGRDASLLAISARTR